MVIASASLARAAEEPELVVGSEIDYPPFATGRSPETAGGFTVDLWRAVAAEAGLRYRLRVAPFHELLSAFRAGDIDVLLNLAESNERRAFADFTIAHFTMQGAAFVRTDGPPVVSEDALRGRELIVLRADLAHDYVVGTRLSERLILVDAAVDGFTRLSRGEGEALLVGKIVGLNTLRKAGITNVKALDVPLGFHQKFAFAVGKGRADLLARLNDGMSLVMATPRYAELREKWFAAYEPDRSLARMVRVALPLLILLGGIGAFAVRQRHLARELTKRTDTLRASEALLKGTLDSTHDGILFVDVEGQVRTMNQRFIELWRVPPELTAPGPYRPLLDFVITQVRDPDAFVARLREIFAAPDTVDFSVIECTDGRVFERVSRPQVVAGRVVGRVWSFHDVTEHQRAEASLRASEQRYRDAVTAVPDSICVVVDEQIVFANPAATTLFGGGFPLPGRRMESLLAADSRQRYRDRARTALATGVPQPYEVSSYRLHDRREIVAEVAIVPMVHDGGAAIQVIVRDVTERRRLEEQLRQSLKMEAVGRLAGGIAHDFNNLLTVINGFSQLIAEGLAPDDPQRERVESIRVAGERAAALTGQLLAFGRKQILSPRPLDLNAVISDMLGMVGRLIGASIETVTALQVELGSVLVDPSQMEQVVLNLAINARDAMPDGGTLSISTRSVRPDAREAAALDLQAGVAYACLEFSDTGIGMDDETRARLFEPFFTTKPLGRGTGLGLATVQGIVIQSGGRIHVESRVGVGTTFRIYLPLVDAAARDATEPGVAEWLPGRTGTVLVVDDEPSVRRLLREALTQRGHRVVEAADGREALDQVMDLDPAQAIVLTDVVMPRMGGVELAHRLRAAGHGARIVFMSGNTDDLRGLDELRATGCPVLQKPLSRAVVIDVVEQQLLANDEAASARLGGAPPA